MEAKKWKTKISANLKQIKVEPKQYEAVINTLADILEQRDACLAKYVEDGAVPIMEYTNKGGATNTVKNPLLILWTDLNTQALAYWRELGLTPSAYTVINFHCTRSVSPFVQNMFVIAVNIIITRSGFILLSMVFILIFDIATINMSNNTRKA